jgi:short-subunit dehydrogenase
MLRLIFEIIGLITAGTLLYRIFSFIHLYFLHTSVLPQYLHPGGKSYALVTGSSDGIGLALAKLLQKRGFNIILHGRNPEKLLRLSSQMNKEFPDRRTLIVAADASDADKSASKVAECVKDVEDSGGKLTVLINNVGGNALFGISPYAPLKDIPSDVINKAIDLNAKFPTLLTRALLPALASNKPGLVINIGSYAGVYGIPYLCIYAPSKAFNHIFSATLSNELKLMSLPIEVLGVIVGSVKTPGNPHEDLNFATLSAEEIAENILGRVGCGKSVVVGSWKQCLLGESLKWVPDKIKESILGQEMLMRIE